METLSLSRAASTDRSPCVTWRALQKRGCSAPCSCQVLDEDPVPSPRGRGWGQHGDGCPREQPCPGRHFRALLALSTSRMFSSSFHDLEKKKIIKKNSRAALLMVPWMHRRAQCWGYGAPWQHPNPRMASQSSLP